MGTGLHRQCATIALLWQVRACKALHRGGAAGGKESHRGGQQ